MSKKFRYSEIFYSFQGEALYAGKPSVWLRFYGCNLECNGFGQTDPTDPSSYILPYATFDVSSVKRLEDLPVWEHGCDSSYSWSTKYKHLVHDNTAAEIADLMTEQIKHPSNPDGLFVHPVTNQDVMLCFTGGEPMMWQKAMVAVLDEYEARGNAPRTITIETNATQKVTADFHNFIASNYRGIHIHFAMSPKLFTVSGEKDAVKPEVIASYINVSHSHVLKFVVDGTDRCWEELEAAVASIRGSTGSTPLDIWVMPVGATKGQQEDGQIGDLAIEAMKRGYNVATRNHCYVFGNTIGK